MVEFEIWSCGVFCWLVVVVVFVFIGFVGLNQLFVMVVDLNVFVSNEEIFLVVV